MGLAVVIAVYAGATSAADRPPGFDPRRHMGVDQIEPGMIGYGLTVFSGVKIERFPVEVISVERDRRPGKAVIWVRCTGERMQKYGPVSGMSGSPIFLYPAGTDADEARPDSARMIGAFAYGFPLGKDCHAGIQPIEQMLAVAARAKAEPDEDDQNLQEPRNVADDADPVDGERAKRRAGRQRALTAALRQVRARRVPDAQAWRVEALAQLAGIDAESSAITGDQPRGRLADDRAMALPLIVGGREQATLLGPLVEPDGLRPMVAGGSAGAAPDWINPHRVELEPGSLMSIPLVLGDLDLPAIGTVTEVLDDGTVLAFGHQYNAQGSIELPMATGFVHFIQPSLQSSFKLGGTLSVVGSIINDEYAAVAGTPKKRHTFRDATVSIDWPGESKDRTYNYRMVTDDFYTPILAGYVAVASLTSDTELPLHATIELRSTLTFEGGRKIEVQALLPEAWAAGVQYEIAPVAGALADTQFGHMQLDRVETQLKVIDRVEQALIVNANAKQPNLAPGGKLEVLVELRPFRGEPFVEKIALDVPDDLAEGQYAVMVSDAPTYLGLRFENRPHLMQVTDMDELFEMVEYIASVRSNALYISLIRNRPAVAVGRSELADLPSSRASTLLQPTSTRATPYMPTVDQVKPMDHVIQGRFVFPISISQRPE